MIKDIHEFLTEAIRNLDTNNKLYPEEFTNFVNNMNKSLIHSVTEDSQYTEDDVNIDVMLDRKITTASNLLIYVTINGVNDRDGRKSAVELFETAISNYAKLCPELSKFKRIRKPSYSHTVDVIEIVYETEKTKVKLNYVVKSVASMLAVNAVRNSDITEVMPVLLFELYKLDIARVPESPTIEFIKQLSSTLERLTQEDNNIIPNGYHEARYRSLFYNVTEDKAAMQKIKAGINLYKFLVNFFGDKLVGISIVANMTGYDTVADINCTLSNNKIVPVSVKSYSSIANSIKIKSLAWHRLICNNLDKNKQILMTEEPYTKFIITDTHNEIAASRDLLHQLELNLMKAHGSDASSRTTVANLALFILSAQPETMVIDTITNGKDVVYHDELSEENINVNTFKGCELKGNTLEVYFGNLVFFIVARYTSKTYATLDVYYNYDYE